MKHYYTLQLCFGQANLQLPYRDCDSFVLSIETQNVTNYLKNLEDLIDFSNLNGNHELFSNKNKKVVGKFKKKATENIWIDEVVCLTSKAYSFKCGIEIQKS